MVERLKPPFQRVRTGLRRFFGFDPVLSEPAQRAAKILMESHKYLQTINLKGYSPFARRKLANYAHFTHAYSEYSHYFSLTVNSVDYIGRHAENFQYKNLQRQIAERLGISIQQATSEIIQVYALLHEYGHAIQYVELGRFRCSKMQEEEHAKANEKRKKLYENIVMGLTKKERKKLWRRILKESRKNSPAPDILEIYEEDQKIRDEMQHEKYSNEFASKFMKEHWTQIFGVSIPQN